MKMLQAFVFFIAVNVMFGILAHFGMSFDALVQGAILMMAVVIWMEVRS